MIKTLPEYLNSIEGKLDQLITLLNQPEKKIEKQILDENNKEIEYRDANAKPTPKRKNQPKT